MFRVFGHYMERRLAALAFGECMILLAMFYIGYFTSYADADLIASGLIVYFPQAAIFTGAAMLSMVGCGLYERRMSLGGKSMIARLATAFAATFVLVAVISYSVPDAEIWRSGLGVALPASFVVILALRWFVELSPLGGKRARRIMIVASSDAMEEVARVVEHPVGGAIEVVQRLSPDAPVLRANDPTSLRRRAEELEVSEIVIDSDDRRSNELPLPPLLECRLAGIPLTDLAEFTERETGRVDLERFRRSWLMFASGFESSRVDRFLKRIFDIVVACLVLVFCMPLMLVVALLVKLEDRGPVIYSQTRVGRNGLPFVLHKFRSMRTDAESTGARWAVTDDPRITRIGRFLRASRIDELPQLFNVLAG